MESGIFLNWYKDFLNEDFNVPVTKKHKQICVFKPNIQKTDLKVHRSVLVEQSKPDLMKLLPDK